MLENEVSPEEVELRAAVNDAIKTVTDAIKTVTDAATRPEHGSPEDRGGADAWYERPRKPHCFEGDTYASFEVCEADMTEAQVAAYNKGYDEQDGRKDWG